MFLERSEKVQTLHERLIRFMDEHVYPNESLYLEQIATGSRWEPVPIQEALKKKAKQAGLVESLSTRQRTGRSINKRRLCTPV